MDTAKRVDVGDDACMWVPIDLEWQLRYGDPVVCRMVAASVVASYRYLIEECNQREAWRRLKLLRSALKQG